MTIRHIRALGLGIVAACLGLGAAAPQAGPKPVFDAMHYQDQPDLRPDLQPVYMLDDGIINRALRVEAQNAVPGAPDAEAAFRRAARAAIGVELDIQQSKWRLPRAYERVPRPICLDLEGPSLLGTDNPPSPGPLDAAASSLERVGTVAWLCKMIDAMRDEAAKHGKTISIGAYCPLLPFARHTHPKDPKYEGWMAAAERDFAPLFRRFDVAYPACEIHSPDLQKWKQDTRTTITRLKRAMPGKPIVPLVPPHYSHYSEESIRWQLIPDDKWAEAMDWLVRQPEVSGVVLWGGTTMRDNPDGTRRDPFANVRKYVERTVEAAGKASPGK